MARVFVLEDDPDRIRILAPLLAAHDWTCIQTCHREYEFKPPYDILLLDHDLGGRQLESNEDCGLTFVRIVKERINADATILLHSYNHDGAAAMKAELPGAIIAPFMGPTFQALLRRLLR